MTVKPYAYAAGWLLLATMLVLFVAGVARSPVHSVRKDFERQLADAAPSTIDINFDRDPDFENWQRVVSDRATLWGPLVPPPKVDAPPPAMEEMLRGVEPTRNKIGTGADMRIQIRVDGKKDYYSKGQQVKGCTIEEITENDVLFTLMQGGLKHGYRLPRK